MYDKCFPSSAIDSDPLSLREAEEDTVSRHAVNVQVMEKSNPAAPASGKNYGAVGGQDHAEPMKFKHLLNSDFQENQTPSLQKNI